MSLRIEALEKGYFIVELRKKKNEAGQVNGMWILGQDSATITIDKKLHMIGITQSKDKFPEKALCGIRSSRTNDRVNWQTLRRGEKVTVGENPGIIIESY